MSYQRIKSIVLLTWYHQKHSLEAWVDDVWWSLITVIVFGFLANLLVIGRSSVKNVEFILVGVLLWEVVRIAQYSISISVLREVWSRNLSNIFTTPISISEFLMAQFIIGLIKVMVVFTLISLIMYKLYYFSIYQLGIVIIIYAINLLVFAWAAGIFIIALIFRFGTRLQALAWSLIYILQPICAAYYPLDVLPTSIQKIAYFFPLTYIFEGARSGLNGSVINWDYIAIASLQNLIYFIAAYSFFNRMFLKSKETGEFARLES